MWIESRSKSKESTVVLSARDLASDENVQNVRSNENT